MVTGTVLRILVQPYANKVTSFLLPISGLLEFLAVAVFAFIILSTVLASKEKREAYDKFIMAGVLWFLLCGVANLFMDGYMLVAGTNEIPKTVYSPFVHVFLLGFVFMFIFAVNIRTVYAFLDVGYGQDWRYKYNILALKSNYTFIFHFSLFKLQVSIFDTNLESYSLFSRIQHFAVCLWYQDL